MKQVHFPQYLQIVGGISHELFNEFWHREEVPVFGATPRVIDGEVSLFLALEAIMMRLALDISEAEDLSLSQSKQLVESYPEACIAAVYEYERTSTAIIELHKDDMITWLVARTGASKSDTNLSNSAAIFDLSDTVNRALAVAGTANRILLQIDEKLRPTD